MRRLARLLALAACAAAFTAAEAAAQTVYVRGMEAGTPIEVVVNREAAGSGKADANGDAVIPISLADTVKKPETDMFVFVDVCGGTPKRVLLIERAALPPAEEDGCERREVVGLFVVRPESSIVVNVGGVNPRVLLVQGRYSLEPEGPGAFWFPARAGFVIFAGGGVSSAGRVADIACGGGIGTTCNDEGSGAAFTVGATYWIRPFLGAEVSFVRPGEAKASGSGEGYRFNSFLDAQTINVVGKVGVPAGVVRAYGHVGGSYHEATFGTTQTMDERTITVDGVEETIPGGTQNFALETAGWGYTWGLGLEAWVTRWLGVYGEFNRTRLKGKAIDDEEGELDAGVNTIFFGARVRIGR